jgi:hypothetical protein
VWFLSVPCGEVAVKGQELGLLAGKVLLPVWITSPLHSEELKAGDVTQ